MRYTTDITIDASGITLPMLGQIDSTLRQYGKPNHALHEGFVEESQDLTISYDFEALDLWDAYKMMEEMKDMLGDHIDGTTKIEIEKPWPAGEQPPKGDD